MRGRLGGIIGAASQPNAVSASRIWSLAEVYSAKRGVYYTDMYGYGPGPWPSSNWVINLPTIQGYYGPEPIDYADATETGSATFSPTVASPSWGVEFSYFWQRSTNAGVTWANVAGSEGTATTESDPYSYGGGVATVSLTVTGQTAANDEDRYRVVVNAGLKTFVGQTLTLRFEPAVTAVWDRGLSSNFNNYGPSLSVSSGTYFVYETSCGFHRTKYSGDPFAPSSLGIESSTDGGTTWQAQSPDYSDGWASGRYYTASSADNGRKWRGVATFLGQTYYSPVATLTVS